MLRGTRAIRGGLVVLEDGAPRAADVIVAAEHIAGIVAPGEGDADEVVDARGLAVLPGAVDAHVHCNEPGRARWEGFLAATRGAAAGGTTTIADMPLNSMPPTTDGASFDLKRASLERAAVVDVALWGGLTGADARPLRELRERGAVGVKTFLSDPGVPEFPRLDHETFAAALAVAARAGLLVGVHAEDEATTRELGARLRGGGRTDPAAWLESRPVDAETGAVGRAVRVAAATGARLHVVHVSAAEAVAAARAVSGADVTIETCPHYLVFTAEDVASAGAVLKCAPPIRDAPNRERLWQHLLAGQIDVVASDHSPSSADLKASTDIWQAWGGVTGVQSLLPALLDAGVHGRGLGLARLARLAATAPARRLGLYPRKGALRVGADADLALVDLEREWTLDPAALQAKSGLSPYVGRRFRGMVRRTIVRGRDVYRDGEVVGAAGYGRFVRSIGPS